MSKIVIFIEVHFNGYNHHTLFGWMRIVRDQMKILKANSFAFTPKKSLTPIQLMLGFSLSTKRSLINSNQTNHCYSSGDGQKSY